jgi:hypothetical protein
VVRNNCLGARDRYEDRRKRTGLSRLTVFREACLFLRHLAVSADLANSKEVLRFLPELNSLETITLTTIDASGEWRLPGPKTFVKKMKIPWTGDDKIDAKTFEDEYKDQLIKAKRGLTQQLLKAGGAYDLPTWTFEVFFQCCSFFDKREDIEIDTKQRQIIKLEMYQGGKSRPSRRLIRR